MRGLTAAADSSPGLRTPSRLAERSCHTLYHILTSMTDTVLLEKHAATLVPSAFQQTSKMPPFPLYVLIKLPSLTDQICKHRSKDPLAKYCPSDENATE